MPFCERCEHRPARCRRRCDRIANGRHLWDVVQEDLARTRGGIVAPHLAWERQSGEVQEAYIAGAQAMRERAR